MPQYGLGEARSAEILLVQDDEVDAILTVGGLEEHGLLNSFHVRCDGEAAIRYLESADVLPDLVLLDLRLRRRDGSDLVRLIRSDPRLAHVPVVVFGRAEVEGEILNRLGLAADAYLSRQPGLEEFLRVVSGLPLFETIIVKCEPPIGG
jgi:CheY-like chemotaxis protein